MNLVRLVGAGGVFWRHWVLLFFEGGGQAVAVAVVMFWVGGDMRRASSGCAAPVACSNVAGVILQLRVAYAHWSRLSISSGFPHRPLGAPEDGRDTHRRNRSVL